MKSENYELSLKTLENLKHALKDVKSGRTFSTVEVRKKLNLR